MWSSGDLGCNIWANVAFLSSETILLNFSQQQGIFFCCLHCFLMLNSIPTKVATNSISHLNHGHMMFVSVNFSLFRLMRSIYSYSGQFIVCIEKLTILGLTLPCSNCHIKTTCANVLGLLFKCCLPLLLTRKPHTGHV